MRRRRKRPQIDVQRLRSSDPGDWLTPAERAHIGGVVEAARAGVPDARVELGWLAPGVRYPGMLIDDGARAVHVVERLIVAHRRRLAGAEYVAATSEPEHVVVGRFRLGRLARDDERRWLATVAIV